MNRLEGVRILVVDDDPDVLDGIDLALRSEGATTLRANDGNEAVMLWRKEAPEAVVLDMMLPKRSGFLVLEKIQEAGAPPPVVMITANQGRRHMEYARNLGVSAYMVKPVALSMLMDKISEVLDASDA